MTDKPLNHIAFIMDGNGRWAQKRGLSRSDGHKEGAKNLRRVLEACQKRGIHYMTLYAFSMASSRLSATAVQPTTLPPSVKSFPSSILAPAT